MKTKQPEIKYEDYKRLIAKVAWQWSKRVRWDWQELMAEGNLAFVQARDRFQTFKTSKPCFSTYLVNFLQHRYIVLINGRNSQKRTFEKADIELDPLTGETQWVLKKTSETVDVELDSLPSHDSSPERMAALKEMIARLSKDAQMLVECTLETPRELLWMIGNRSHSVRISRHVLQRYFVQRKGWSMSQFWKVSKEIREALITL